MTRRAKRSHVLAAIAVAGTGLIAFSGCAAPAEPAKAPPSRSNEDCMFSLVVKEWTALDTQQFIIYGLSHSDAYLAKAQMPTPDLTNHLGMAIIDDDHNGRICGYSTDSIQFRNATIPGPIRITALRKITREEADTLIAAAKNKGKPAKPEPAAKPE
jgi:hypothetical protein